MQNEEIKLEVKMEGIRSDERAKDFKKHLTFNISKICQQLFHCFKALKLEILKRNVVFLEPLSEDKNLVFDLNNQLYLVDFINFDVLLAGGLTRPVLHGSCVLLPKWTRSPQLVGLVGQNGLFGAQRLFPGLVREAADKLPHSLQ